MNLAGCAEEIQHRLIHIFSRDEHGRRAVNGGNPKLNRDPHFRDYVHFYEVRLSFSLGLLVLMTHTVLPRKRRSRNWCIPPNWVDGPGRVDDHADGRVLPPAQDAQE